VREPEATRAAIEAVWRLEAARLMGGLVRLVRDVGRAEDLAQDALLCALDRWPQEGIPRNPGAWLMTTAKNRALDLLRRDQVAARGLEQVSAWSAGEPWEAAAPVEGVGDDLLRLLLIACHPILSREARGALTLRLLGGLTTEEIARAFLAPTPTIAQRIVRAKKTLAEARVPFEVPRGAALAARLPSVYEVIYLIFNEGYAATRGEQLLRRELCEEAMRLGRVLVGLVPEEAEAHGLLALMELHASRLRTRTDSDGDPVLLLDQDRARWDHLLIRRGLAALARAEALAQPLGPYTLQAAIAACHARARVAAQTDWARIVALYDALVEQSGSPIAALNRAVAVGMAYGPEAGLACADALVEEPALRHYHLLPAVRAELLERAGRVEEAREAFARAAALTQNERERALLLRRAQRRG
jgi:RNA polymerase sigma-70 factor (ECF subfamily)